MTQDPQITALMEAADEYARECGFTAMKHPDASEKICDEVRAALKSAITSLLDKLSAAELQTKQADARGDDAMRRYHDAEARAEKAVALLREVSDIPSWRAEDELPEMTKRIDAFFAGATHVIADNVEHVECEECGAYFACHRCGKTTPEVHLASPPPRTEPSPVALQERERIVRWLRNMPQHGSPYYTNGMFEQDCANAAAALAAQPSQIREGAPDVLRDSCQHGTPYRYACEQCQVEDAAPPEPAAQPNNGKGN